MKRYIIDEKFLKELGGLFFLDERMLKKINDTLDHPYNPQAEQCVYWGMKEGKHCCAFLIPEPDLYVELTDKIKQAEREKVLGEVEKRVAAYRFSDYDRQQLILSVLSIINEIREVGTVEDV